jgi:hypothetical protein
MTIIKFKSTATNIGPMTVDDGKHKPMPLHKPDGTPLHGGDLVPGRVYEVDITTGRVRWPPRNRKARRRAK